MTAIYGLMAEFDEPEQVLAAAKRAFAAGYRRLDAFTPFPVDGLPEALGSRHTPVAGIMLAGGLFGGVGAYFMQWWAAVESYPANIGGRPLHSWPAFIPVTFELTVLSAAFSGVFIGILGLSRLPRLDHPAFNVPRFKHASQDAFFLAIEVEDPLFERRETLRFLEQLSAHAVYEVPR